VSKKRRNHARLSGPAQWNLYGAFLLALASGVSWYALKHWGQIEGEFGLEPNPWQPVCMKLHGAASMWCLLTCGYLTARHMPSGMNQKRNRLSGFILSAWIASLIVTGWMLYYLGSERREQIAELHWWLGASVALALVVHVIAGFKTRPERALQLAREAEARRLAGLPPEPEDGD
jgi:hypothetical protein